MNRTCTLLLHHWRRTRLWLIPPLLISALWTVSNGSNIWRSKSLDVAWNAMQTSVIGNVFVLAAGALILVVAMGSGEASSAFPRYAQTLPVSNRRWSLSCVLYSLIVFSIFAAAITLSNRYVWNHAVEVDRVGVAAAEQRYFAEQEKTRQEQIQAEAIKQRENPVEEPPTSDVSMQELRRRAQEAAKTPFTAGMSRGIRPTGNRTVPRWEQSPPRQMGRRLEKYQNWAVFDWWRQPLLLISIALFCHSLFAALTLIQRVPIRVFAIAVALVLAPAAGSFLSYSSNFQPGNCSGPDPVRFIFIQYVWPFLLVSCAALIMYTSARRERHGDGWFRRTAEVLTWQVGNPRLGFSSPARALAWYDWMTFGRYLIYGAAGAAIAFSLIYVFNEFSRPEITGMPILPICGLASIYLAYRLYYGDIQDNDAYLVTLPVTVERLTKSRLVTTTKFVAAASVIAILLETFIVLGYFTLYDYSYWPQTNVWILLTPLCGWVLIWLAGPLFYPAIATWFLAVAVAVLLQVLLPRNHLVQQESEVVALLAGLCLCSAFVLAATIWLVRRAKRRNLLFKWNKRLAVSAWLAAAAVTISAIWAAPREFAGMPPAMSIVALALCLLPAVPFLALPLAIDRYRHRAPDRVPPLQKGELPQ